MRPLSLCLLYFTLHSKLVFSEVKKVKKILPDEKEELKNAAVPPCKLCRVLVQSFERGMDRTARSSFQGGDTAWEEEKLGNYASSEIRLVEIQEKLCDDVDKGNTQCHSFAEEVEPELENWWFHEKTEHPNLFDWLCIKTKNQCCPPDHYGPSCLPCPGFPSSVCYGNGRCRGSGTRKGNGTCGCDIGYNGINCDSCADNFFVSYKDESKLLCSKCHAACNGNCTQAGPQGCLMCNKGWFYESDRGCIDINECVSNSNPCSVNEFCVNNEGSFSCLSCDKACNGCLGDGPDMCDKCADGYSLQDGICVKDNSVWEGKGDTIRREEL